MCETLAITGFPAIAHLVGQKSTLEGHRRDMGEISKRNGYLILLRLSILAVPAAPLDPHFRNREIGGTLARDIGKSHGLKTSEPLQINDSIPTAEESTKLILNYTVYPVLAAT